MFQKEEHEVGLHRLHSTAAQQMPSDWMLHLSCMLLTSMLVYKIQKEIIEQNHNCFFVR